MNENDQLLLTVLLRLGFVDRKQISGLNDATLGAESNSIDQLVADGLISDQKLSIAKHLAQKLPPDASDQQIDDLIVKSYGSLDRSINPSLVGIDQSNYDTDVDPRLKPENNRVDPNETLDPSGLDPNETLMPSEQAAELDPYKTIPPQAPKVAGEATRAGGFRFRVIRKHAEGGLGMVSLAEDVDFGRDVAVKEIKERFADIPDSRSRFVYEAEITGRLEHPGIVPVYALGKYQDGRPFYAMRFVTGESLDASIKELHDPANASNFSSRLRGLLSRFQSVCNTMEYSHSRQVIHRDLKPDNIMIGEYGENLVVDWGLAKSLAPKEKSGSASGANGSTGNMHQSQSGSIVGTPYYMSPEQATGDSDLVGPQADVYSLGATLFHLLTGKPPYRDSKVESVTQLLDLVKEGKTSSPRELNSRVPKTLDAICMAAMEVDMSKRYPSAAAMGNDIERFLADDRVSVAKETMAERVGRWSRKNKSWTMAIAASVLIIALATSIASVVTIRALNETEQANQKLGNQLALARLEQDFDSEIVKEERRQNESGLSIEQISMDPKLASRLQEKIQQIEAIRKSISTDSATDQQRRQRLLNNWSNSVDLILSRPSFSMSVEQKVRSEIARFDDEYRWKETKEFQDRFAALSERLQSRLQEWRPSEFSGYPESQFVDEGDVWRRLPVEDSDDWLVLVGDCPSADLSIEVQFGAGAKTYPMLGLLLNATGEKSYRFVLAEQGYDPGYIFDDGDSLQELSDRGQLWMYIVRQDSEFEFTILRKQPVELEGDLRLRVRREGATRLTFSAGGGSFIEFDDPFPTSVSELGRFGVLCPGGVTVGDMAIQYHQLNEDLEYAPNPIMLGDARRAADEIVAARAEYEKLPNDLEAKFKLAITFEGDEQIRLLREIVDNFSPSGSIDERAKRWYLNAAVRLMNSYMNRDMRVFAGYVQDRIAPIYSVEDVRNLVPAADKAEFTKMLLKPGQRWRIAYVNDGDAASLRRTIKLFSDSPQLRRDAVWRWCDAVRCDTSLTAQEGRKLAIPAMRELIDEVQGLPDRNELELNGMVSDLVWMLLAQDQLDEAMEVVKPFLAGPIEKLPIRRVPLLIERARILHRQGDVSKAEADLKTVVSRINRKTLQEGVHFAHFSEAHALLGMIAADSGDSEAAQAYWLKGRRRNWYRDIPTEQQMAEIRGVEMVLEDVACDEILASWTDGYTEEMLEAVLSSIFGGSGVEDSALLNIVKRTEKIPEDWLKMIAESFYAGSRGRDEGRRYLLRQSSLRGNTTYGAMIMLYQAVLQTAFGGEESLERYPEMDETLYRHIQSLIAAYQKQAFVQKEMAFILGAWTGKDWNSNTFESLAERINDESLSASMAFIFSVQMIKHEGKLELGQKVLDKYVYPMKNELPEFYFDIIDETIRNAQAKKPEEVSTP